MAPGVPCIANIGPRERQKRLIVGLVITVCGVVAAACLVATGAPRMWRAAVFVPLLVGALGLFQAKESTCVALAARGARNMDGGNEPIADPAELSRIRAQARRVRLKALVLAVLLSTAIIAVPVWPWVAGVVVRESR